MVINHLINYNYLINFLRPCGVDVHQGFWYVGKGRNSVHNIPFTFVFIHLFDILQ